MPVRSDDIGWAALGRSDTNLGPLRLQAMRGVMLRDLKGRAELNGRRGTILSYDEAKERYGVRVGGDKLSVKAANLNVLYARVGGGEAVCGDPQANFLKLPVPLDDGLRWEDTTQLLSNEHSLAHNSRCKVIPDFNKKKLEVKASAVPGAGRGVFTAEKIAKGEMVTQFGGVWRDPAAVGSESYSQRTSRGMIEGDPQVDDVTHGVAQLINDGACIDIECDAFAYLNRSNALRNVAMAVVEDVVVAVALRDIEEGEELYHSYGAAFWLGRLQRASLLAHDLALARKCDAEYAAHHETERLMLSSGNTSVRWKPTPALAVRDGELFDETTQRPASQDACRQLCWARLGVESFTLAPPGKPPQECHVLATYALLLRTPPEKIPTWCIDRS